MRSLIGLTLCLAFLATPLTGACAKSRKDGQAAPAQSRDPNAIKLPKDLTTNNDWLEDQQAATHGPTGESRLLHQQENFDMQDPTRNTGSWQYWNDR